MLSQVVLLRKARQSVTPTVIFVTLHKLDYLPQDIVSRDSKCIFSSGRSTSTWMTWGKTRLTPANACSSTLLSHARMATEVGRHSVFYISCYMEYKGYSGGHIAFRGGH